MFVFKLLDSLKNTFKKTKIPKFRNFLKIITILKNAGIFELKSYLAEKVD